MKKILGLIVAMVLFTGMAGIGTWAYFSDTESSTGNTITAGTLDLKTNDVDGVTATLPATNMGPGDSTGPQTITLKNNGSTASASLDMSFSYVNTDVGPNTIPMTADQTAFMLEVTTLDYGATDLAAIVDDSNGNGWLDLQDLLVDFSNEMVGLTPGLAAGASVVFGIEVVLRAGTSADYQDDGITVTMNFVLNQ